MSQKNLLIRVNQGLEEVRPYLAKDGGDLSLVKISSDLTVFIRFEGACKTCDVKESYWVTVSGGGGAIKQQ